MLLKGKQISEIGSEDLASLVIDATPESDQLEYKLELPGGGDAERKEFLADVCALANSGGGVILYGIEEAVDEAGRKTGTPRSLPGLEGLGEADEILRLQQIVRSGLSPPLGGAEFRCLPSPETRHPVLIVGVPGSLLAPHAVAYKTKLPFYRRAGASKHAVAVDELRQLFLGREEWLDVESH